MNPWKTKMKKFVYKVLIKTVDHSLNFVTRSNDIRSIENQVGVVAIIHKLHDVICGVKLNQSQYKDMFKSILVKLTFNSVNGYFFKIHSIIHQLNWYRIELKAKDIVAILFTNLPDEFKTFKVNTGNEHKNSVNPSDFFDDMNDYEKSLNKYVEDELLRQSYVLEFEHSTGGNQSTSTTSTSSSFKPKPNQASVSNLNAAATNDGRPI